MARMKLIALLAMALLLQACITRSTAPPMADASSADAAQYNLELGIGYLRQGNLQAAREKLLRAIKEEPDLATAHSALGLVYERLEDPDGALREYRKAVDLDLQNPDSLNVLAVFLCSQRNEPKEALRYFDKAIAIPLSVRNANRAMLYTNAGTCAKRVDMPLAETYLRRALQENPQFPDALLQLATVTYEQGNALQARAFLERYLAAAKPSAAGLWLGVRIEQSLNDGAAARKYADQLRQQFPDSAEAGLLRAQPRPKG